MGQLERYGLYVLCVVIVLILGVAIWGGDPASASTGPDLELEQALASGADDSARVGSQAEREQGGFFSPVPPPAQPPPTSLDEYELADVSFVEGAGAAPASAGEGRQEPPRQSGTHALRTYRVKPNDTMSGIAKRLLGGERYADDIKKLNPGVDPRRMRPGTELTLPPDGAASSASKKDAATTPKGWREYKVKRGDTPGGISTKMYNTSRFAKEILAANDISDPTKLQINAVLRIPPIE